MVRYGYTREVKHDVGTILSRLPQLLDNAGFVLTSSVDMSEKMKEWLGIDFRRYFILSACHPAALNRALDAEPQSGLLFPCTLVVYENGDHTVVGSIRSSTVMSVVENGTVREAALFMESKLKDVIDLI